MEKKIYQTPRMTVVNIDIKTSLLAGSSMDIYDGSTTIQMAPYNEDNEALEILNNLGIGIGF